MRLAESLFECSIYEKGEDKTAHIKIQYKNHEYSIAEFCQKMEQLEKQLKTSTRSDENE